ncbi:hypothetical protein S40285_07579 [Stachybotrys chlorohalonatus IBT 40285]|uniref:Methyltransferase domain-containing protein n=1 Tax=Stachybotrys chlorohalonatus (strain IBT 40285) TaxID=1283841 RepID=A0A084Q995_STAC4|nr:hypothetical protein S40285_07579 [Stachybotrys chlorohalonata IBT 40285]
MSLPSDSRELMAQQSSPRRPSDTDDDDDDDEPEHSFDGDQGKDETDGDGGDGDGDDVTSNYSSVSEDTVPPIRAYGHTYYGDGRFFFPNDASEARRLALQHELLKLCLGGQLTAARLPAGVPLDVLDVGSGTGQWACELGEAFPRADVLGVDVTSALMPKDVPPNVTFEMADATDAWPPRRYDLVHMRNLVGGGVRDWRALLRTAFAHLKPGGQLEFTELRPRFFDVAPEHADLPAGATPQIGAACVAFERAFEDACARVGLDMDPAPHVPGWLAEVGAQGIRERGDWVPVKSWGHDPLSRRKGAILSEMIECGLENWVLMLFGVCGWEEAATRALLERVKQETRDPLLRSYVKVTFITARKPLEDDEGG